MKKLLSVITTAALVCSLSAGSVFAFSDLDTAEKEPILQLKDRGIVAGLDSEHFAPRGTISFAQSISLLVKGLNLNIDTIRFIKQPLASDYFTNVPNDAWYAEAFIIAKLNGLEIPQNVDPNATITREQYANLLVPAMETKGQFPLIKMLIIFADDDQITPSYQGALQRMYLYKLAKLDEDRKVNPKQEMTRGEAAVLLYNAIQYVEKHTVQQPQPQQGDVKVIVEQVNADVNKVILSRGEMPNPGYGIAITGISFQADGTAAITYTLSDPKPDGMYAQVITEAKAETYVSAKYKPIAVNAAGSPSNSTGIVVDPTAPIINPFANN
ncbi:protease complex subunit PrcB family protein [Paenibacillus foliorum]|nr:protease complex subunit PrcB family protein [Paenibacillus foliorum]